jgi:hypothetical protein
VENAPDIIVPAVEGISLPPQPEQSIADTARALRESLSAGDPPKRGPGRVSKAQLALESQADAARHARVRVLSIAFTATFGTLVHNWGMQPPFGSAQGEALAEAWDPVILQYLRESGPVAQAVITTAVVMSPYMLQAAARIGAKRNAKLKLVKDAEPEHSDRGATGIGKDAT